MDQTGSKRINPIRDGAAIREFKSFPPNPDLHTYSTWGLVVEMYTKGQLTKENDKLVAIAGVAAMFKALLDDEYLAGLWRRYLPNQLLWHVDDGWRNRSKNKRPECPIAPSWSWASIIGPVANACDIYFADERDILIKILDITMDTDGMSQLGQKEQGAIVLQGRLAQMLITYNKWDTEDSII